MAAQTECGTCGLMSQVQQFLVQPMTSLASNTNWFLFVLLILIAAYLWRVLLGELENFIP